MQTLELAKKALESARSRIVEESEGENAVVEKYGTSVLLRMIDNALDAIALEMMA